MPWWKKTFRIVCVALVLCACSNCGSDRQDTSLEQLYRAAVEDAMHADADEIETNLSMISVQNPDLRWKDGMVLVVTFTHYPDSYPVGETINTWWGDTWVTAAPELQKAFTSMPNAAAEPLLRIEQLLGLPQETGNQWFAELWVRPEDLFRPCPDNEITDSVCELTFPDTATDDYILWFENLTTTSYADNPAYPWTRLGYTYDWAPGTDEVGLSEFVIRPEAEVLVEQVTKFDTYLSIELR